MQAEDRLGHRAQVGSFDPAVGDRLVERAPAQARSGQPGAVSGTRGPDVEFLIPRTRTGTGHVGGQAGQHERVKIWDLARCDQPGREQGTGVGSGQDPGTRYPGTR